MSNLDYGKTAILDAPRRTGTYGTQRRTSPFEPRPISEGSQQRERPSRVTPADVQSLLKDVEFDPRSYVQPNEE